MKMLWCLFICKHQSPCICTGSFFMNVFMRLIYENVLSVAIIDGVGNIDQQLDRNVDRQRDGNGDADLGISNDLIDHSRNIQQHVEHEID